MSDDPRYIWLAPKCATEHYRDDRCWCSTPEELVCEECGAKPVAYVRAGKSTAGLIEALAAANQRIAELTTALEAMLSEFVGPYEEGWGSVVKARAALEAYVRG